jgi:hypothetical protein
MRSGCASILSVRILATIILLTGLCGAAGRVPRFDDFAVKSLFRGSPVSPRFTNPRVVRPNLEADDRLPDADDRYRESVALDALRGPNFAGQYTIARWSCGTGCSSMVVVNAKTGTLYRDAPFGTLDTSGNPQSENHQYAGLSFQKDSSLLIIEGCFDADFRDAKGEPPDCNRSYYQWVSPRFKLLRKIPLAAPL